MKYVVLFLILGVWLAGPVSAREPMMTGMPETPRGGTESGRMKPEAVKAMEKITDMKKRQSAEKLSQKLCLVQSKQTKELSKALESVGSVLGKVTAQAAELKGKGVDTAAIDAAVTKADSLRAQAKANLSTFMGAGCGLVVSGNTQTLATESGRNISQVEQQLKELKNQVKAARQAAENAVKLLATARKGEPQK